MLRITGVKFVVERADGQITTWHDVLSRKVDQILLEMMPIKKWENGIVKEAYIEFDHNGEYCKTHLDCDRLTQILAD